MRCGEGTGADEDCTPRTVAWPDARNASTVRALRQKAKGVPFETPLGVVEGEEGVRAMTGLPFSCVLERPLALN